MAKFWGKIFIINFAVGVVDRHHPGVPIRHQLVPLLPLRGDIFGSLLAIEATLAFFLESTFLAVWIFGWNRLSPKFHAVCIWLVALASNFIGRVDLDRQCLDAASGGLRPQKTAAPNSIIFWPSSPALCLSNYFSYRQRCLYCGGFFCHGDQRLPSAAPAKHLVFTKFLFAWA